MLETNYQSKIMKAITSCGGQVVNGTYTKAGEADLQCGYPYTIKSINRKVLLYIAIEVKTEYDYNRVMSALSEDENGKYTIIDPKKLKNHESLQIIKINIVREKSGLAMVAWNFEQVKEYIEKEMHGT